MYKNILIATDGSELSEKAVQAGLALARTLQAKVAAVHAVPSRFMLTSGEMETIDSHMLDKLRASAKKAGEKVLDGVQEEARKAGVDCGRVLIESDWPWDAILRAAQERSSDVIVMAAHGYTDFRALVLGSETNKVLTHSKIPVLVYR